MCLMLQHKDRARRKQFPKSRLWPCAFWLISLNRGKKFQNSVASLWCQAESMAVNQSTIGRLLVANRRADQASLDGSQVPLTLVFRRLTW